MAKRLDRVRVRGLKENQSVVVNTRLKPGELLLLDDIAREQSRTVCGLLGVLARECIENHRPWRWA